MSANRILMHVPAPCPRCAIRRQAEALTDLCERIEDDAAIPRALCGPSDPEDFEDSDDDEPRPVVAITPPDQEELEHDGDGAKFRLRLRIYLNPMTMGGDLRQHTADELRRVGEELVAAAERVEGGVSS